MSDFTFNTTPSIRQIAGGAAQMGSVIASIESVPPKSTVLFVTDPGLMQLGLANPAIGNLRSHEYDVIVFDEVEPDPQASIVDHVTDLARKAGVSSVIGFGGGSSMDVAKVVALSLGSEQSLGEMYGVANARGIRAPLVLVPTTAGTGSEVTPISILTVGSTEKKGISSPLILPDIALLDCDLTLGLPPSVTAATGIDAMVHAIEAYTSKNANNNPISRILAIQALKLLGANIKSAVFDGENREARANMLLGSMLAGQAFANSPVAAVHALAYPIGSFFHVPHGLSNALVLPAVMRFNASECCTEYAELAPYVFPDIKNHHSDESTCNEFIDRMTKLSQELGLDLGLVSVGIGADNVELLARESMKQTRLLVNNPRQVNEEDARQIYSASL